MRFPFILSNLSSCLAHETHVIENLTKTQEEINEDEEKLLEAFFSKDAGPQQTLADVILRKIKQKDQMPPGSYVLLAFPPLIVLITITVLLHLSDIMIRLCLYSRSNLFFL